MNLKKDIEWIKTSSELQIEAVKHCLNNAESVPMLLSIIDEVFEEGFMHVYEGSLGPVLSVLMLAEMREVALIERIIDLCHMDIELLETVFGDFYEVMFPVALGSICKDVTIIDEIIEDREVSDVAVVTAIQSYLTLLQSDVINRELCFNKFKIIFEREDLSLFTMSVAVACVLNIHPRAIESSIKNAYKNEFIDEDMIPMTLVDKVLKQKKDKLLKQFKEDKRFKTIDNAIEYFNEYMQS